MHLHKAGNLHVCTVHCINLATQLTFLAGEMIIMPVPPIPNMQDQVRFTIWQLTTLEACSCKPLIAKLTSVHHTLLQQP